MKRIKGIKLLFAFAALFMTVAMFSGCGSKESDSGGPDVQPVEDAAWTGNCTICHTYEVHTNISGIAGVNSDTLGRGSAITHECEACHGGGQYHHGDGPIPFPSPGGDRCATCHEQATAVLASKHNAEEAENFSMIADGHDTGKCQRCHTAEGSRAFATIIGAKTAYDVIYSYGATPTAGQTTEALPNLDADGNRILHNPVCATCHNPLTKTMVSIAGWDPNNNGTADQFDLCTSCHVYQLNNNGTLVGSGTVASGTAAFYHDTSWYRIIATTHYDNPATGYGLATNKIEGYNLRKNSANPCFDCHGHELTTHTRQNQTPPKPATNHTDWAKSRHGGKLLSAKYAVTQNPDGTWISTSTGQVDLVMAAGREDLIGAGWSWTHYNWDQTTGTGNRSTCQRCHTSTGSSNFFTNPTTYDPVNNDFSHLASWTAATGSPQNEMLYCWACHTSVETGALRNPGTPTFTYTNGATQTFPDVTSSNICVACHSGRETGDSIKLDADADGTRSFINSHYLSAGGTVFTSTGYEYAGRNYNNVTFYAHDQIARGTDARMATWETTNGTPGPCVGCHMSSPNKHSFANITKDDLTGAITAITSTVCSNCHTDAYAMTTTVLNDEEHEYHASLDTLAGAMTLKGIYYNAGSYPYFFTDATYVTAFTTWAAPYGFAFYKDTMGAAFNLNLLGHDPGGYAHNRYYSKGLIWDSIDFIDNGALDNSVPATITALETATTIDAATAAAARLYLGSTRPGDASRP